jgi:hypothetical protein
MSSACGSLAIRSAAPASIFSACSSSLSHALESWSAAHAHQGPRGGTESRHGQAARPRESEHRSGDDRDEAPRRRGAQAGQAAHAPSAQDVAPVARARASSAATRQRPRPTRAARRTLQCVRDSPTLGASRDRQRRSPPQRSIRDSADALASAARDDRLPRDGAMEPVAGLAALVGDGLAVPCLDGRELAVCGPSAGACAVSSGSRPPNLRADRRI